MSAERHHTTRKNASIGLEGNRQVSAHSAYFKRVQPLRELSQALINVEVIPPRLNHPLAEMHLTPPLISLATLPRHVIACEAISASVHLLHITT